MGKSTSIIRTASPEPDRCEAAMNVKKLTATSPRKPVAVACTLMSDMPLEQFVDLLKLVIKCSHGRNNTKTKLDFIYTHDVLTGKQERNDREFFDTVASAELFKSAAFMSEIYNESAIRVGARLS